MKISRCERAFSLVELVVVVLIIALLASIVFSILGPVKARTRIVPCTQNLRQMFTAISIYRNNNNDRLPNYLWEVSNKSMSGVMKCPSDTSETGSNGYESRIAGVPVSYFFLPALRDFRVDLDAADPDHGLVYCVLHGEPFGRTGEDPRMDTRGLVLRMLLDGSVQQETVGFRCEYSRTGVLAFRPEWSLLTNAPCPPEWCVGVPCWDPTAR